METPKIYSIEEWNLNMELLNASFDLADDRMKTALEAGADINFAHKILHLRTDKGEIFEGDKEIPISAIFSEFAGTRPHVAAYATDGKFSLHKISELAAYAQDHAIDLAAQRQKCLGVLLNHQKKSHEPDERALNANAAIRVELGANTRTIITPLVSALGRLYMDVPQEVRDIEVETFQMLVEDKRVDKNLTYKAGDFIPPLSSDFVAPLVLFAFDQTFDPRALTALVAQPETDLVSVLPDVTGSDEIDLPTYWKNIAAARIHDAQKLMSDKEYTAFVDRFNEITEMSDEESLKIPDEEKIQYQKAKGYRLAMQEAELNESFAIAYEAGLQERAKRPAFANKRKGNEPELPRPGTSLRLARPRHSRTRQTPHSRATPVDDENKGPAV